jgi:hypothetical protein
MRCCAHLEHASAQGPCRPRQKMSRAGKRLGERGKEDRRHTAATSQRPGARAERAAGGVRGEGESGTPTSSHTRTRAAGARTGDRGRDVGDGGQSQRDLAELHVHVHVHVHFSEHVAKWFRKGTNATLLICFGKSEIREKNKLQIEN